MASYSYTATIYCKGDKEIMENFIKDFRLRLVQIDCSEEEFEVYEPNEFNDCMMDEGVYKAVFNCEEVRFIPMIEDFYDYWDYYGLSFFTYIEDLDNSFDTKTSSHWFIVDLENETSLQNEIIFEETDLDVDFEDRHAEALEIIYRWRENEMQPVLDLWLSGFFDADISADTSYDSGSNTRFFKKDEEILYITISDKFFITTYRKRSGAKAFLSVKKFNTNTECKKELEKLICEKLDEEGYEEEIEEEEL